MKVIIKKKVCIILMVMALFIIGLFILVRAIGDNIKYETSRDDIITSPSGKYQLYIRYDYVSSLYIFKDGKLLFKTGGYNEQVFFKFKWESENVLYVYLEQGKEKYNKDKYYVTID